MLFGFGRAAMSSYHYNIRPFATISGYMLDQRLLTREGLVNIAGNIAVFIPFGWLMPLVIKKKRSFVFFLTGLLVLETAQLLTKRGSFDVDDFILNAIGYGIGTIVWRRGKRGFAAKNAVSRPARRLR